MQCNPWKNMESKAGKIDPWPELERMRTIMGSCPELVGCVDIDPPMPLTLPAKEQIAHLHKYARISIANDAWGRQLGRKQGRDMLGGSWRMFIPGTSSQQLDVEKKIIRAGYILPNLKTWEPVEGEEPRIWLNNIIGVMEGGKVSRICRISRDITEEERNHAGFRKRNINTGWWPILPMTGNTGKARTGN